MRSDLRQGKTSAHRVVYGTTAQALCTPVREAFRAQFIASGDHCPIGRGARAAARRLRHHPEASGRRVEVERSDLVRLMVQ